MRVLKYLTIISVLFLFSCSEQSPESSTDTHDHEIAWFDGTVDEAFAAAKKLDKPLFLYWGAVWCPPCQEIKHTVFKSRQFIAQTESFVPVYLDGDTDEAQAMGEKFGVKGYPTMIVFNAKHEEITRIPGGIDISQYNDILALSLNSITPTATLVAIALENPNELTEANFQQLAYYSWGQDNNALPENYSPTLFANLSELAQDETASARLYMQYLYEASKVNDTIEADKITKDASKVIPSAEKKIKHILNSDKLVLACWDSIAYYATEFLPYIAEGEAANKLAILWQQRILALSSNKSLSITEQLAGLLPTLEFYFNAEGDKDKILNDELKQTVIAAIEKTNKAAKNSFARQSVVNQMSYILQTAKLMSEAKKLLTDELQRSKSPYYFMSSLASIAEKEKDFNQAIALRKQAFDNATGAATRLQWGASYVRTLIRLQPKDSEIIKTTAVELFNELDNDRDAFVGRNFRVLRSLNKNLKKWQVENDNVEITAFTAAVKLRCDKQIAGTVNFKNCITLLAGHDENTVTKG